MNNQKKTERDALCPECGHAFKAYVDRLIPKAENKRQKSVVQCPVCGCGECKIGRE